MPTRAVDLEECCLEGIISPNLRGAVAKFAAAVWHCQDNSTLL
jgi:hypothetical protein